MNQKTADRLDSDVIRQGLLSIRNSQIELLNELKNETQQLKKTPIRFNTSTEDSKSDPQTKMDNIFSFPPENAESIVRYNPPSPASVDKPFSFGLAPERQMQSQVTYLKDENRMLNETLQKLLYSRSLDKQRVRELESYLYFSSKIHLQLFNQLLSGTSVTDVRKTFENDLRLNEDVYSKYQQSNHQLILQLLQEKEAGQSPFRIGSTPTNSKQQQLTSQLGELKQQLVMLLKTSNMKNQNKASFDMENGRLKQHNDMLIKKLEEFQARTLKLESDNKELALCWEREINQRKAVVAELERVRRETGLSSERERQLTFMHQEVEQKLNHVNKVLREKETAELANAQNLKKMSETVNSLKEENEKLKKDIKSIEELRNTLKKEDMTASKIRENDMMAKINQQSFAIRNYEKEIFQLRHHLEETKRNFEAVAQMNARQRETDAINQQLYWKKLHMIRTNSTVQHLWQVKEVEYSNVNELLSEIKGIKEKTVHI